MADDPKKNKPGDDLLEGFDDAFDGGIDKSEQDNFVDEQNHDEKTEFYDKEDVEGAAPPVKRQVEKTEVVFKDEEEISDENRTQIEIKDEQGQESNAPGFEPTRNAVLPPKIPTEDLVSLFEEPNEAHEGKTDSQIYDAANVQQPKQTITEDLSSLIDSSEPKSESFTENFSTEIHSDDVLGRSGATSPKAEPKKEAVSEDLSSLIEEEISSKQGKTEDLSSLIQSDAIEGVTDDDVPTTQSPVLPKFVPPAQKKEPVKKQESAPAFEESIAPMPAEDSKTVRVRTKKQKIIMGVSAAAGILIVGVGGAMFLKSRKTSQPAQVEPAATSAPEKVVDSQELLKELEEKYKLVEPLFLSDRYQSYTEAVTRLEEIVNIYPNHPKANARLAEAILLKFDGFLDEGRKNRVYQLIEKAENVDANTAETLRVKARSLMVDGKNKDALVRIQQAINQSPKDVPSLQTAGEIELATGDTKAALASFSKAMQLQPEYIRAKYFNYLTLEEMGNTRTARDGFMQLASQNPPHTKSAIERYAIDIDADMDVAMNNLQQFLTTKETELGPSEAAKGWQLISQIELKKNNMQGAIDALEKSIFKLPLDSRTAFQLGNLYFKQNNFEKASQHYSTAVTLDPNRSDYLLQLGISLREQGRLKESEENLKKLVSKDPTNFEALYQHALSKYRLGFVDDVIAELQQNIKDNPEFLQGKILLGNILLDKNDLKTSLKYFQEVLSGTKDRKITKMALNSLGDYYSRQELWSKARGYYSQALDKDLENYEIRSSLAKVDLQLGDIAGARMHLQKMEKINPGKSDGKVLKGLILVKEKEYDSAIATFKEVIDKNDNDYETRVELAKVYIEKHQYSDALQELTTAYRFNAEYFYTYFYLGITYQGLNDLAESERNLLKAISILPKFYKAHYELGVTYLRKEDVKKGEEELREALALQPTFAPALVQLGDYFYERNVFDSASVYYLQALEIQPTNTDILLKQAKTYRELNDDKKAAVLYQKIIQIKPNSADTYYELGILYEENNNLSLALKNYQRSLSLNPKNPKPYYQLGFLYRAMGQNAKAIQAFKKFLALSPDAIEKPDIEDQIQKMSKH